MAGKLTAVAVKAAVRPGRYGDGGGLHLYVRDAERRTWVLRYRRDGKSRDMGLGSYPDVSLAEAREKTTAAHKLLRDGIDPLEERQRTKAAANTAQERTFRVAAEGLIADKAAGWRNEKHRWQWRATLETHAYPPFGDWPVHKVDSEAVMDVLRPLWERVPETASRLRGRIEAVLDAAKARGWRDGKNPARWKGLLAVRLPPPRKVPPPKNYPSLPWKDVPAFVTELRLREGMAARAVELAILTAARSGEVRGMCRGEVNLQTAIWTCPAIRMKASKPHRVPLSQPALALLRSIRPQKMAADVLVFPGTKPGKPLSDMSLTAVLRRMNEVEEGEPPPWIDPIQGLPITVHGFRSSFRVWAGECAPYPREVVEAALAHTIKDRAEAAYARTDLLERRRPLMKNRAAFCGGGAVVGAKVIPMRAPIAS